MSKKISIELTKAEISHVLTLLLWARRDGAYYGPEEQFEKRHDRILAKLESVINEG